MSASYFRERHKKLKRNTQEVSSSVSLVRAAPPAPTPAGQPIVQMGLQQVEIHQLDDQMPPMDQSSNTVQYVLSDTGTTCM